jgi:hypothetical protein
MDIIPDNTTYFQVKATQIICVALWCNILYPGRGELSLWLNNGLQ